MNIIYAKKFRLPDGAANIIQGLNMIAAFSACSAQVHSFFSFDTQFENIETFFSAIHGWRAGELGEYTIAPQSGRGLRYSWWLARRILTSEKGSLIYTRENWAARQALRFRFLHLPPLPVFHEVHKFNFNMESTTVSALRRRNKMCNLLARVDGVVFIDEGLQALAREHLGLRIPSHVAPSGVDLSIFGQQPGALPSSEVLLGYFGKISEDKGVMLLAGALRFLPEQYRLRLVGDIVEKDKSLLLGAAGAAANRIEFRDRVAPIHLAEAMQGVHISVIPFILENQFLSPLKLAESLAMGLPLVCTPISHLERSLEHGKHALFAENMTPEALGKAIRTLGDSPELMERMQRENRAYAQQFSWEKRAQGIIDFMRDVTEKRRR